MVLRCVLGNVLDEVEFDFFASFSEPSKASIGAGLPVGITGDKRCTPAAAIGTAGEPAAGLDVPASMAAFASPPLDGETAAVDFRRTQGRHWWAVPGSHR